MTITDRPRPEPTAPPEPRRVPPGLWLVMGVLVLTLSVLLTALALRRADGDPVRSLASEGRAAPGSTATTIAAASGSAEVAGSAGSGAAPSAPSAPADANPSIPGPAVSVTSVSAPAVFACGDAPGTGTARQLTLTWSTTGAESVTVAIDSPGGAFASGLPAAGSLTVPAPCAPDSNTYFVTAVGADGTRATSSTTTSGR